MFESGQAVRSVRVRQVGLWVLCSAVALLALGCGEETEMPAGSGNTLHAIASVLLTEDVTGPLVDARLILVSTESGTAEFVTDVDDVVLDAGGEDVDLPSRLVRLGGGLETNFFAVNSRTDSKLAYVPGETYTFSFSRDGQDYSLSIDVPPSSGEVTPTDDEAETNQDLIVSAPGGFSGGIVEVRLQAANETTYSSDPYEESSLQSAQDVLDKEAALKASSGGLLTLPSDAFSRSGTHSIVFIGLSLEQGSGSSGISDNLGDRSVVFAGEAASIDVDVR